MKISLHKPGQGIEGRIVLSGSKSISNRVLVIRALCGVNFSISHLADAKDTQLLEALLSSSDDIYDAGAAGTTFRFMTAYLASQPGIQILTGTERMKQRPVGVLVDALRQLGAKIEYLENEGYPPLKIRDAQNFGHLSQLSIAASTSSQYISALLLIAPTLSNGLALKLKGKIVSRPYIEMTLKLMQYFGVTHDWSGDTIHIRPQAYQPSPFTVEADWSAASYYYSMAAFANHVDLQLDGLFKESTQGDAVLSEMMETFGITTTYNSKGIHLTKPAKTVAPRSFEWDFLRCPDLAQTLAVTCAGTGTRGSFTGLETLRIKETDRITALQNELKKVKVSLTESPDSEAYYEINGKAKVPSLPPTFATYEDHRMAMAFAPMAMLGPIEIEEPNVVVKSYPRFWEDLEKLEFEIAGVSSKE